MAETANQLLKCTKKRVASRTEGGDPSPLFSTGEITPRVLVPVLSYPVQKSYVYTAVTSAKDWKNDIETGASFIQS